MIFFKNFIKESSNNKFEIICEINEKHLLQITNQKNIKESIENEFKYIKTLFLIDILKLQNNSYKLIINVDNQILKDTDKFNIEEAIHTEFNWLKQSGIFIKTINVIS